MAFCWQLSGVLIHNLALNFRKPIKFLNPADFPNAGRESNWLVLLMGERGSLFKLQIEAFPHLKHPGVVILDDMAVAAFPVSNHESPASYVFTLSLRGCRYFHS